MTVYWPDYVESNCRQNYSYYVSSEFLMTGYHTLALITIPLSIFTFFTIIRVTPTKMKNMKIPMLIALAWSTNLDLMLTVHLTPFMFFPSAAGVPMGLLGSVMTEAKWLAYLGQVSIITFYLEDSNQLELRQFVLKRIPCPAIEFYDKNAIVLLKGGELLPFLSISGGLMIIVVQSLFFSIHTVYHLNYVKNAHVSESTKALQRKFLSYVAMQVTIPWTALVTPILYSLYADKNDYYDQTLNNISMLLMASHGLMSTACTLFIIKPYREFVKSIFKGNKSYNPKELWATSVQNRGSIGSVTTG
ncbi:unnamed protein product [Caenorhabditis brenneri]